MRFDSTPIHRILLVSEVDSGASRGTSMNSVCIHFGQMTDSIEVSRFSQLLKLSRDVQLFLCHQPTTNTSSLPTKHLETSLLHTVQSPSSSRKADLMDSTHPIDNMDEEEVADFIRRNTRGETPAPEDRSMERTSHIHHHPGRSSMRPEFRLPWDELTTTGDIPAAQNGNASARSAGTSYNTMGLIRVKRRAQYLLLAETSCLHATSQKAAVLPRPAAVSARLPVRGGALTSAWMLQGVLLKKSLLPDVASSEVVPTTLALSPRARPQAPQGGATSNSLLQLATLSKAGPTISRHRHAAARMVFLKAVSKPSTTPTLWFSRSARSV